MSSRLVAAALVLVVTGCNEECVDQFDCVKIASKSPLTCEDGRCVVKTTLPMIPSFAVPDAGRTDGGAPVTGDGGIQPGRVVNGDYQARLSGGQLVPPVTTMASGNATATLSTDDAGVSTLAYSMTFMNVAPTNAVLMFGAPAGRSVFNIVPLNDGGVTSPFAGSVRLSRSQAEAVSAFRSSIVLTSATQPLGELRGQIIPRGAFIGFTQFTKTGGGYGGGGQLVLEVDGGFIPVAGSYELNWAESGAVASASVSQGGTGAPILQLPLNATATGSAGTFDPLTLLFMLRDAGVYVTGSSADGGEVFRGDLSLSLR
ncbi:MAG: CHRD domain-containing protein [Archangiaceae bacterium]|nr:CHRD domain-containing protein [Archangiaceae bacterium]